ncbi:MAG: TatD family hydrolase [Bacteroidales bacterium]|nr:TatD family hydrolase [Bacteroidales bacterium]MCF8457644.1 TatD family hydrolase [Bacteroidales bacterium]
MLIDTHSHIYLEQFNEDREAVVALSLEAGVERILLPNIDSSSIADMLKLEQKFPKICFAMMGLHPGSVKENWEEELHVIEDWFTKRSFIGVGEIGIDLYWDKTFQEEQKIVFARQIQLAQKLDLPFVIHSRNSFPEVFQVLEENYKGAYKGIFHAFSGNEEQGRKAINMGFKLGIGGVVTYKNAGLDKTVQKLGIDHLVLETDSPYLTPVPHRGKRNESAYVAIIAAFIADILGLSLKKVATITTENAKKVFGID